MLKRFVRKSRFVTFVLLIVFLGAEVFLRWQYSEQLCIRQYPTIYSPDTTMGYRGIPNIRGHIHLPSINKQFQLNGFGLYAQDFTRDHPDSIFRILIGGSSIVEGVWANQPVAYPTMLDSMFKVKGYRVEVINCAVSGLNRSWQDMMLLREDVVKFHANLALFERPFPITHLNYFRESYKGYSLLFTGNNGSERSLSEFAARRKVEWLLAHPVVTGVYDLSYCLRELTNHAGDYPWNTIYDRWRDYGGHNPESWQNYDPKEMTVRESIYWLNGIEAEMNKQGCELVAFEYGNNDMSDRIRASDEVRFPYLSLALPLDDPCYHHELDAHYNYLGFTLITTKLFDLLSHDYVPAAFRPKMIQPQTLN